jgi:hypothetical protein
MDFSRAPITKSCARCSLLFSVIVIISYYCSYQVTNSFDYARLVADSSKLITDDPIRTSGMGNNSLAIIAKLSNEIPISKSSSLGKLPTWMKGTYTSTTLLSVSCPIRNLNDLNVSFCFRLFCMALQGKKQIERHQLAG